MEEIRLVAVELAAAGCDTMVWAESVGEDVRSAVDAVRSALWVAQDGQLSRFVYVGGLDTVVEGIDGSGMGHLPSWFAELEVRKALGSGLPAVLVGWSPP